MAIPCHTCASLNRLGFTQLCKNPDMESFCKRGSSGVVPPPGPFQITKFLQQKLAEPTGVLLTFPCRTQLKACFPSFGELSKREARTAHATQHNRLTTDKSWSRPKWWSIFQCDGMVHVFSCPGSSIPDLGQSVSQWLTHCHFRISTQRLTFET